jgi:peptide/nickel transport system permease protein
MTPANNPDGTVTTATRRTVQNLSAASWLGVIIVTAAILASVIGPLVAPYQPGQIVGSAYLPPGVFPLGTDVLGRDLLSRLLYGARFTVQIAIASTVLGFVLGTTIGLVAAEVRGSVDAVIVWLVDILLGVPPLMLGLLIIAGFSPGLWILIGTIALIHVPRVARVSRSVALNVAALQFVEVARARGEPLPSILLREILPNCARPLGVEFGMRFTYSVLFASALSFLGLGIQPPAADWGMMLRENMDALHVGTYWSLLSPALLIGTLAIGVNLIVDWLGGQSGQSIPDELR